MNLLSSVEKLALISHLQSQNNQMKLIKNSRPFRKTFFQVLSTNIFEFISQLELGDYFEGEKTVLISSFNYLHLIQANAVQIDPFLINKSCEIGRIVKFSCEKPDIKGVRGVYAEGFEEFSANMEEFEKIRDTVIPTELICAMKPVFDAEEQLWRLKKTPCTFPIYWQKNALK
ncbi:Hypothetical_protein [Hexamita inflata]|uniref:Hypothetical_protein n=1 Tax=Hexamita inflata TaxID=28002 RepID=A0ABP1I106_9EUKA